MHFVEAKGILSNRNGMNIYRGCTHGCIYCDSRSNCYNMNHEFQDIEVKSNVVELLEKELKSKRERCMIGTGSMSDPYMIEELKLGNMRKCLEIIEKHKFGVTIITKSDRILRDLDLLKSINEESKCVVQMTLTTYDEELCKKIEPNVCTTKRRFEVLKVLRDNGIPTVVWITPILPFINDTEENIRGILNYCIEAKVYGIIFFGAGLTLREGNREYFYKKLDEKFPGIREKYEKKYGFSYGCMSDNNSTLTRLVYDTCRKNQIMYNNNLIFNWLSEYENRHEQLTLW